MTASTKNSRASQPSHGSKKTLSEHLIPGYHFYVKRWSVFELVDSGHASHGNYRLYIVGCMQELPVFDSEEDGHEAFYAKAEVVSSEFDSINKKAIMSALDQKMREIRANFKACSYNFEAYNHAPGVSSPLTMKLIRKEHLTEFEKTVMFSGLEFLETLEKLV